MWREDKKHFKFAQNLECFSYIAFDSVSQNQFLESINQKPGGATAFRLHCNVPQTILMSLAHWTALWKVKVTDKQAEAGKWSMHFFFFKFTSMEIGACYTKQTEQHIKCVNVWFKHINLGSDWLLVCVSFLLRLGFTPFSIWAKWGIMTSPYWWVLLTSITYPVQSDHMSRWVYTVAFVLN